MALQNNFCRRAGVHAVHSRDRFVFSVPDLEPARRFYTAFGLDVREAGRHLDWFCRIKHFSLSRHTRGSVFVG